MSPDYLSQVFFPSEKTNYGVIDSLEQYHPGLHCDSGLLFLFPVLRFVKDEGYDFTNYFFLKGDIRKPGFRHFLVVHRKQSWNSRGVIPT